MGLQKAQRKRAKLRIGLAGPSGTGKTYSALLLARWLATAWNKIAIIDTENGSGELYANSGDIGDYMVYPLRDFKPTSYIWAIRECEAAGMEVIIIDSITHEWKYILEAVDKLASWYRSGNSYTAWNKATPMHDMFIQAILQSGCHVITTVRSKQDYSMDKDENGKTKIQKVGMKQETRDGFEYELTVAFDINVAHMATVSKDRTHLFDDMPFLITSAIWEKLKEWNDAGEDLPPPQPEEKKDNEIVTLTPPPSAPPVKHTEPKVEDLPPPKDGKLSPAERNTIINQWAPIWEMIVYVDDIKAEKGTERLKMLEVIQALPHIWERKIKSSIDLKKSDLKFILDRFLELSRQYREKSKEKHEKEKITPHEDTGATGYNERFKGYF